MTHIDNSESILLQFWSLHETRLKHCLALRSFEENFKEIQCNFIQLYHDIIQLPDLNTNLFLFQTDNNNNIEKEMNRIGNQVDDLSQRAQVNNHIIQM